MDRAHNTGKLVLNLGYVLPVSYTHLDVYKRQLENLKFELSAREADRNTYLLNWLAIFYPVDIKLKHLYPCLSLCFTTSIFYPKE